jgi:hypothetical protein
MRHRLIVTAVALALAPSAGFAQGVVVEGTVGSGRVVEVPAEVRSYVIRERAPSVRIQEEIVVGETLPSTVELRTIPDYDDYRFAIVNEQRVLVEPRTRRVVRIID